MSNLPENLKTFDEISKEIASSPKKYIGIDALRINKNCKMRLEKAGITKLDHLKKDHLLQAGITSKDLTKITEQLQRPLKDACRYSNFKELFQYRLNERELTIIYGRYGLVREERTLAEIGEDMGVTRERIRQIEAECIKKLKKGLLFLDPQPLTEIESYAQKITPIEDTVSISKYFKPKGLLLLVSSLLSNEYLVISKKKLTVEFLIKNSYKSKLDTKLSYAIKLLSNQKAFVPISQLGEETGLPSHVLRSINGAVVDNKHIAIKTNHDIFSKKAKVESVFDINEGPLSVDQIVKRTEFNERQVRSTLDYNNETFANTGMSKYALKEWGYLGGSTADIIEHYLNEAGEPLKLSNIKSLVFNQKDVSESAIYAALDQDKFMRVDKGIYALSEWSEYEEIKTRDVSYKVSSKEAILEVLSESKRPLMESDIKHRIEGKFGEDASTKDVTLYSMLSRLEEDRVVHVDRRKNANYYTLKT